MKTETKSQAENEITLFHNNVITNDPCCLCGNRTDPDGLDYGINKRLVCIDCVKKFKPDLILIRKEVQSLIRSEVCFAEKSIYDKIKIVFKETIEQRILRAICPDEEVPF